MINFEINDRCLAGTGKFLEIKAGTLDQKPLIKAIQETDYAGSIGRIRFKDHEIIFGENPLEKSILVVYQWKDGKRVPVFPGSVAEGPISKPKWMK